MRQASMLRWTRKLLPVAAGALVLGCSTVDTPTASGDRLIVALRNWSKTPVLVKGLPSGVEAFSLISSDDTLPGSPNFVFGGSADGAGLLKNADRTFTLLVNNEDNFAVSRIKLDTLFRPVSGDYALNSTAGRYRLCSATLATPAEHGFGPVFIAAGESSAESMIHALDPNGAANSSRLLPALGRWNTENAVPLQKEAFPGKTVIVIGDDDSGAQGGQVALYVSNTVGDLDNGSLYVLARTNDNIRERDMVVGQTYPVVFRRVENQATLTGAQINQKSVELKSVQFGRVEDIDYRRGSNGREIYFNVTGQNNTGTNADYSRSKYGRVYRLNMNATDPTQGTLEVIIDGDDRTGPAREFQNVDNITVTTNYVYTAEDPNGYGDETHDARIYQYNIATRELKVVMEVDHRRSAADAAKYNVGGPSRFGSWEFGALIDVSVELGIPDTFLLAVQPHTWRGTRYQGVDGGTLRPNEDQASQILVIKGLPR